MEIVIPSQSSMDFDFSSAYCTPYSTAPSTPKPFGHSYFSAPASPARAHEFYQDFRHELAMFNQQKPSKSKSGDDDFLFEFKNVDLEKTSQYSSAEDLFDHGKIKPLKQKPTKTIQSGFPPKQNIAPVFEDKNTDDHGKLRKSPSSSVCSKSRKWSLKELFLFRSASEGRASDKDPFKKYSSTQLKKSDHDVRNPSFRSSEGVSTSGSSSKRKGPVSAHELHYTMNRAASEDLKKKTYLPYKQGIMGRFSLYPFSSGFGTMTRG